MEKSTRLFVAIQLPDATRTYLNDHVEAVRRELHAAALERTVRWVPRANLHLTLRFLGATAGDQQRAMRSGLDRIARDHTPFTLSIGACGGFPNLEMPRVIWLGVEGALPALSQLQAAVETVAQDAGFDAEQARFSPHITVGRARRGLSNRERLALGLELERVCQRVEQAVPKQRVECDIPVTELTLMRSILKVTGTEYRILTRFKLG